MSKHTIPNKAMARGYYKRRGRLPAHWESLPIPEEVKAELAEQYKPYAEGSISNLWLECGGIGCSYLRLWLGKPGKPNRQLLWKWDRSLVEFRRESYLQCFNP